MQIGLLQAFPSYLLTISDLLANGEQEVEDCSERKITESPHRGIKAFSEEKENNKE